MNLIFLKNRRRAVKFDPSIKKSVLLSKRIELLKSNKAKILAAIKGRIEAKREKKI